MSAPDGVAPLPLSPKTFFAFADQARIIVSPPRPLIIGSTTAIIPAMATVASKALPPCSSTRSPTCVANGELDDATHRLVNTGDRRPRKPVGSSGRTAAGSAAITPEASPAAVRVGTAARNRRRCICEYGIGCVVPPSGPEGVCRAGS
jgi:hypothetical protein